MSMFLRTWKVWRRRGHHKLCFSFFTTYTSVFFSCTPFLAKMPIQREQWQFAVLLLCVPIQYFIVQYSGTSETTRTYQISNMVSQIRDFQSRWFRIEPWTRWCQSLVLKITEGALSKPSAAEDLGESPAFEVLKYREKDGFFGTSADIRITRGPHVKFRVGQVVKHKRWGYRGVIVGWDETARAPEAWLKQMHENNRHWRDQPNYSILVDTRDRTAPQLTYVPQENIEVAKGTKVLHPNVDEFFETYDGSQYLPRPWLRGLYPRD